MSEELTKMLLPELVEAEKRLADKDARIAALEQKLAAAGLSNIK